LIELSHSSIRIEDAFVLHCVRRFIGSESGEEGFQLLEKVSDWSYVQDFASGHRITPMVKHLVDESGWKSLPELCSQELQTRSREGAVQALSLTAELLAVLDLFDLHEISAVPFKGPALASELYGDLARRDFCDIDILIRREDVPRAKDVLLAKGYRTDLPVRPAEEAAYLHARDELHFSTPDGSLIEIHQAFLAPFFSLSLDYQALWQRLERRRFCGREIFALAPEDLLLALCAHGTKHCWSRLAWVCDIARLLIVFRSKLDWDLVTSRSSFCGARRMVLLGLLLATRLLNASLPEAVLKQAGEDVTALRLARTVELSWFADGHAISEMQSHQFFLQARERLRDKIIYCTRLAFMPNEEDHSAFPLPKFLSPLLYPLHTVRVLRKYGLAAVKSSQVS
jgi:hypothetical protein